MEIYLVCFSSLNGILAWPGTLTQKELEVERDEEHRRAKREHRSVESGISALENHGLDRCLDHGIFGFKRYVGYSIVARNIQIIGHLLARKETRRLERLSRKNIINAA